MSPAGVLDGYCRALVSTGTEIVLYTHRPTLRRLLLTSRLADAARIETTADRHAGRAEPYTYPHRR
jgi:hypothetical protein